MKNIHSDEMWDEMNVSNKMTGWRAHPHRAEMLERTIQMPENGDD